MNSPFDVFMKQFKDSGMDVAVKRQGKNGEIHEAKPAELETLSTKSRIASTAQLLSKLSDEEKLEWARETKHQGNTYFAEGQFSMAMKEYVDALTASKFDDDSNIDCLVVPVLCNLAACCIELHEWGKAVQFCEQAIDLRPFCSKAYLRKGLAFLRIYEYQRALEDLKRAEQFSLLSSLNVHGIGGSNEQRDDEATPFDSVPNTPASPTYNVDSSIDKIDHRFLSQRDRQRIPSLIAEAKRGIMKNREAHLRQRRSLAKGFEMQNTKPTTVSPQITAAESTVHSSISTIGIYDDIAARLENIIIQTSEMTWWEAFLFIVNRAIELVFTLVLRIRETLRAYGS
jgi:tetratricopeptide (TPR) repeat protein